MKDGSGRSPKIQVAHLVLSLETGGLETVVLNLVRHGDRDRFDHTVVCLREAGRLASEVEAAGGRVVALRAAGRMSMLRSLLRVLSARSIEVLHTHNPLPHQLGALARLVRGGPLLIHTKHGRNFPGQWRAVLVNRLCSRVSDAVVAVSEDAALVARRIEGVSPDKVRVIYNGIEVERYGGSGSGRVEPRGICVARLDPVKDIPTLLDAVKRIRESVPAFSLDVVGEGADRDRIERERARLGLEEAVTLRGQRSDVAALLSGAAVFLLASRSEGVSLTLLEAMAAGLPVVATAVGGNPEVVSDGITGLLVPPADPAALAAAVVRLLSTPGLPREMGLAGRRRVGELFHVRKMAQRYESLYLERLASAGGR